MQVDVEPYGLTKWEALARLEASTASGCRPTVHPTTLRAVTHLDVSDDDIERAIDLIPRALGVLVEA